MRMASSARVTREATNRTVMPIVALYRVGVPFGAKGKAPAWLLRARCSPMIASIASQIGAALNDAQERRA